jgi:hypothetical protein
MTAAAMTAKAVLYLPASAMTARVERSMAAVWVAMRSERQL